MQHFTDIYDTEVQRCLDLDCVLKFKVTNDKNIILIIYIYIYIYVYIRIYIIFTQHILFMDMDSFIYIAG